MAEINIVFGITVETRNREPLVFTRLMVDHAFAASTRAKFQKLPDLSPQPCIYKAPGYLLKAYGECYTPSIISIGPLYYSHPPLAGMQDCKLRCLEFFLDHENNSFRFNLEHYMEIIREMEAELRNSYSEKISLSSEDFNGMILADSAFIICNFMRLHPNPFLSSQAVAILSDISKRCLFNWNSNLRMDLFREENQIPFFILEHLFEIAFLQAYPCTSFLDLACIYIAERIPSANLEAVSGAIIERIRNESRKVAHLIDLLRNICVPSTLQQISPQLTNVVFPPSVSILKAAGVKFVASDSASCLVDIRFSNGVLEIPPIVLDDKGENYFRSMILFEQSHEPITNYAYISHFITLFEKLIKTPEDVQILVEGGIICNWTGSDETIKRHFNGGLTKHIDLPINFYFSGLCQDLNAYADTKWNQWNAILKRDYFSHPWAIISVIYAVLLLVLTALQTYGTFKCK